MQNMGDFLTVGVLPMEFGWYECGGQRVFPLFGKDGSILTDSGAWVVGFPRGSGPLMAAGIRFTYAEVKKMNYSMLQEKVSEAMTRLEPIDPAGGPLPKIPDST